MSTKKRSTSDTTSHRKKNKREERVIYETKKLYRPGGQDYFTDKSTCVSYTQDLLKQRRQNKNALVTNPKFSPHFDQAEYHAGDLHDIYHFGLLPLLLQEKNISHPRGSPPTHVASLPFHPHFLRKFSPNDTAYHGSQSLSAILNTFKYIFHKMKKGIFVHIEDGKLHTFLPFSNANFHNSWYHYLAVDQDDQVILTEMHQMEMKLREMEQDPQTPQDKYVTLLHAFLQKEDEAIHYFSQWLEAINEPDPDHPTRRPLLNTRDVVKNRREWYANNCIFREEEWEGDKGVNVYKDILTQFVESGHADELRVSFFLNPRDFPIMQQNQYEPYEQLYGSSRIRDEHVDDYYGIHRREFAPILSFSGKQEFVDIPTITTDDWEYSSQHLFPEMCNDRYQQSNLQGLVTTWGDKTKSMAIFRGTATGCGMDVSTNMRLKACALSKEFPTVLDAKISAWNIKFKKTITSGVLTFLDVEQRDSLRTELDLQTDLKQYYLSAVEQSQYKYILNLDGHSRACRLGHAFSLGSVLLLPQRVHYLWFEQFLLPFHPLTMPLERATHAHYIPIRPDLEDVIPILEWCQQHDEVCQQIAENGKQFFEMYLSRKEFQFQYLRNVFELLTTDPHQQPIPHPLTPHKFAWIVAYRDSVLKGGQTRAQQLEQFQTALQRLLSPGQCDLYVIEQTKDGLFNLGKNKNIGFLEAMQVEEYSHYVLSDIDLIPDIELLPYYVTPPRPNHVLALAHRGTVYEHPTFDSLPRKGIRYQPSNDAQRYASMIPSLFHQWHTPFLGGALSVTKDTFFRVNGYPNDFWGWGGEDDELVLRIAEMGVIVDIPRRGRVIDLEESITPIRSRNQSKEKEMNKYEKLSLNRERWKQNGLTNLLYRIQETRHQPSSTSTAHQHLVCSIDILPHGTPYDHWYKETYQSRYQHVPDARRSYARTRQNELKQSLQVEWV